MQACALSFIFQFIANISLDSSFLPKRIRFMCTANVLSIRGLGTLTSYNDHRL